MRVRYTHSYILSFSPKWVCVRGVTYKRKCIMVLEPAVPEIDKEPLFGQVEDVFVVDSIHVYVHVNVLTHLSTTIISVHTLLNSQPIRKCIT